MSTKNIVADRSEARVSASTEHADAYQAAIVRFDAHSAIGAVHECAEQNGWDVITFLRDVWHELHDGNFEPWSAQPVPAER